MYAGEVWRPVPYDPRYEVSSLGRVRRGTKILKPVLHEGGYVRVTFPKQNGKTRKKLYLHRIVCEVFHGPAPEGKPLACHDDGNPWNNRADNLKWGSSQDNADDTVRHGRVASFPEEHHPKTLSMAVMDHARSLAARGLSTRQVAAATGIGKSLAARLASGQHWSTP